MYLPIAYSWCPKIAYLLLSTASLLKGLSPPVPLPTPIAVRGKVEFQESFRNASSLYLSLPRSFKMFFLNNKLCPLSKLLFFVGY